MEREAKGIADAVREFARVWTTLRVGVLAEGCVSCGPGAPFAIVQRSPLPYLGIRWKRTPSQTGAPPWMSDEILTVQ